MGLDAVHGEMRPDGPNPGFAFLYNGLGIPVAAGVPYRLGITRSPMPAAMSLRSVSMIGNALRLRHQRLPEV
ncbi:hypothetical protein [Stenotrophomonas rhizophila]|uniref:hypothetical protein n=1 Tax=Stenotrophomonas rhizophila TaxID=216778 RepID=UPI001E57C8C6|nr:hypothetical protein [Stenotrophomonas rhizophila]MCC7636119.1 hypothetical protein [Stenotrophomonas rhizophila]